MTRLVSFHGTATWIRPCAQHPSKLQSIVFTSVHQSAIRRHLDSGLPPPAGTAVALFHSSSGISTAAFIQSMMSGNGSFHPFE